jgi:hypothetical protein
MFLKFNDVLVRDEKREPFKRCFNRCYAALNVSHEYEEARILEGLGKVGVPNNDRRGPPRRDPAVGAARVRSLISETRHPSSRSSDDRLRRHQPSVKRRYR